MTDSSHTDLKFFTNEPGETLHGRFVNTLKYAQYFDVLVGYFRTSGFNRLHKSFDSVEKIRILVGLNADYKTYEIIQSANVQQSIDFESHKKTREQFSESLIAEMDHEEDSSDVESSTRAFIELLRSGKLELKAHPSRDIHAKVYISRYPSDFPNYGSVITGSSNFSESGFVAQREFNVELKDTTDVKFALEKFEELWKEAVDITDDYIDTIETKTWLSEQITPYDIYLKFIYEYFKEDINIDEDIDPMLPEGFMKLEYQRQAVLSARKILDAYGGVFLSDVVGLGKTFISALLLQQLPGRKLIICPPCTC